MALNVIASFVIDDRATLARLSLCGAGVWWAVFMLLPLRHLPRSSLAAKPIVGSVLTAGFRELGHTVRGLRQVPLTLLFLLAYLIYYDGISTVTTPAVARRGQHAAGHPGWGRRDPRASIVMTTTYRDPVLVHQMATLRGQRWRLKQT